MTNDASKLVSISFVSLLQVHKKLIRNCLGFPMAKFCSWDTPVGQDSLFTYLNKKLKDCDDIQFKLRTCSRYW